MRVLIINTSERTGGAALAATRIMEALNNNGVKAKMLVRDKETDSITVVGLGRNIMRQWHFLWERWCIFCHTGFSKKHLFDIDIANSGNDITRLREFREADVIHLNWINQGMLSLGGIRKILASGKPVVWTMHDIWPATAICHLTLGCAKYAGQGCQKCKYLPGGGMDLAKRVWQRKRRILQDGNITFVACSKWLAAEAGKSTLLTGQKISSIPNPIDRHVFCPADKRQARLRCKLPADGTRLIYFISQKASNANKGMAYLIEAYGKLMRQRPELEGKVAIVIAGGHAEQFEGSFGCPVYPLGYINDTQRLVDVYNAVDVFVTPSLSENLPNTIMEAMACGLPCVGFNVGGIPEMIDHKKTGYVAAYKDADDLARGMEWVLCEGDTATMGNNAVAKVAQCYSQHSVALKYIEVYNQALACKRYKI